LELALALAIRRGDGEAKLVGDGCTFAAWGKAGLLQLN